jgi:cytochrome c-type protein NapC
MKKRRRFGISLGTFVAFFAGIIAWGGFNTAMDVTNTTEFCIGCHEMSDNVYEEYTGTIHFSNRSGVSASCSDCHVPKSWGPKVLRKIYASNELYHAMLGTIDTPEKFESHRLEMAERVWASMRETDSRECRNCHSYTSMNPELQERSASRRHDPERLAETGKTCIDCHEGIAHKLPEDY